MAGRLFIIESQNDQVVNEHERGQLKRFYARVRVHTFGGARHLGRGVFKAKETARLIKDFFG
jgi:hypothetical protein